MAKSQRTPYPGEEEEKAKLFADCFDEFVDALECLYLYDNISGRHQFRQQWPHAAHYIYPRDLLKIDEVGTQDKEFRSRLEVQADTRRIELIDEIEDLKELYQKEGAISTLHISGMLYKMGRSLTAYIIDEAVLEKIDPKQQENIQEETSFERLKAHALEPEDGPNLALPRRLFQSEPASSKVLTYEKLLRKVMRSPHKHRLRNAFNKACKHQK